MATIRNPTQFRLTSLPIDRIVEPGEIIDGLTDEEADAVCASGVFERGVLVMPDDEPEAKEEKPERPAGRRTAKRGAVEVEEAVEDDRETR